jgi:hypothetical protein
LVSFWKNLWGTIDSGLQSSPERILPLAPKRVLPLASSLRIGFFLRKPMKNHRFWPAELARKGTPFGSPKGTPFGF